jgi:hypothetical protein
LEGCEVSEINACGIDRGSAYAVHCFTAATAAAGLFPESSYEADSPEGVAEIVRNCSREVSGIVRIVIEINGARGPC